MYLVIYLKHCLCYLFAKSDFTCSLGQNDLEKQLKEWVVALNNLTTSTQDSVKLHLLAHSTF